MTPVLSPGTKTSSVFLSLDGTTIPESPDREAQARGLYRGHEETVAAGGGCWQLKVQAL